MYFKCYKQVLRKTRQELHLVVDDCNPGTLEAEAGDCEFKASPNYIAKSCLKQKNKQNQNKTTKGQGLWYNDCALP